jgi:hypothetical protein
VARLVLRQQQRFHRGSPFIGIVFRFRQFRNVLAGIAQRAQRLLLPGNMIGSKNS